MAAVAEAAVEVEAVASPVARIVSRRVSSCSNTNTSRTSVLPPVSA